MNLTLEFPRSPKITFAGLVHVPRMADKARARRDNLLGEYIYPCPLDEIMLDFLETSADEFEELACTHTDAEVERWVADRVADKPAGQVDAVNRRILEARPDTPEKQEKFRKLRDMVDPARTDINTWVELIDLEEKRL